jgi:glycosyltransferase involved in cell wall biosynthesis
MKVWAHTLVKNESRWLWFSVASVVDHVEKILLWDTGSTDGSLDVIKELQGKFPGKIEFRERKINSAEDFTEVRQEMLDVTKSDWFLMVDGDEIWYEDSIKKVIKAINIADDRIESIVVPTINLVGDIFHFQEEAAGRYKFGDRVGHYGLRAVKRAIPSLHSQGGHGVWGWADKMGKMVQDRNTFKFVDAPYIHTTSLRRSSMDEKVIKRAKKYRYEIGEAFPKDFYYPEVFFRDRPEWVISPWGTASAGYRFRAFFETPLRKIKRRIWEGKVGY